MKKALIISLSLNVILVFGYVIKRYYYRQSIASSPSTWSITWNKEKGDLYSKLPINKGDVVFIGDSHVERFLLHEYFPCSNIKNRGIGSNTTMQVINRLGEILDRKPSKLFIQIGINDLATGWSIDSTLTNLKKIMSMIDRSVTTPYVISLFPTRGPDEYLNDAIKELNQRVADYCIRNRIEFINVYSALVKYGELNKEFSSDGTHLNSKGYGILKDSIKKYLN